MRSYIKSDLYRYYGTCSFKYFVKAYFLIPGFRVMFYYRICKYFKNRNYLLYIFFRLLHRRYVIKYGIEIPINATIGYGFYIGHFGGIVLSSAAVIGDNCNISHGVTIGVGGRNGNKGIPVLGNCVYIGPGAKLFGKISIGNYAAIGANAVVTKSFPDYAVITGIPGKQISSVGSNEFILNPFIICESAT